MSYHFFSTACDKETEAYGVRNHGSRFEKHKAAYEEGAAADDAVFDDDSVESDRGSTPIGEKEMGDHYVRHDEITRDAEKQ